MQRPANPGPREPQVFFPPPNAGGGETTTYPNTTILEDGSLGATAAPIVAREQAPGPFLPGAALPGQTYAGHAAEGGAPLGEGATPKTRSMFSAIKGAFSSVKPMFTGQLGQTPPVSSAALGDALMPVNATAGPPVTSGGPQIQQAYPQANGNVVNSVYVPISGVAQRAMPQPLMTSTTNRQPAPRQMTPQQTPPQYQMPIHQLPLQSAPIHMQGLPEQIRTPPPPPAPPTTPATPYYTPPQGPPPQRPITPPAPTEWLNAVGQPYNYGLTDNQYMQNAVSPHTSPQKANDWDTRSSSGRSRAMKPKFNLRTFGRDPAYTIEEFISTMNDYVRGFDDQPHEIVAAVKSFIAGEAATIVLDSGADCWEGIRDALWAHYRPVGDDRTHQHIMAKMKKHPDESAQSLSIRVRSTGRRAYPKSTFDCMEPFLIQTFLRAWGDEDVERTVLGMDERSYQTVIQLASRLHMAEMGSTAPRKPTVLHFADHRVKDEHEEATVARINKMVVSRVDEALTDFQRQNRGRSRERNDRAPSTARAVTIAAQNDAPRQSYTGARNDHRYNREGRSSGDRRPNNRDGYGQQSAQSPRDNYGQQSAHNQRDSYGQQSAHNARDNYGQQRAQGNDYGQRDGDRQRSTSGGRFRRDQSSGRRRSSSRGRTCFKCQGKGHFIAECPSSCWYKADGTVDEDRTAIEGRNDPNEGRALPRPT